MNKLTQRLYLAILPAASLLLASAAMAANTSTDRTPHMPAVVTDKTPSATEPAAGRNSFTEKQATERLSAKGYTMISPMSKDNSGVWRGTAYINHVKHRVAVDYQGNVTTDQ